ncbi:CHAD domain-containing protein [Novispirillum sp. DQ9]|uniref:CYTH and CHAD domain-containing protein n=1 Tax=Novispirillum sp. DQ9 TaxID=3398612 RepID=UPI003C7C214D
MATEIELKLDVEPRHLDRLRRHAAVREAKQGRAVTRTLVSVYFDTPQQHLRKAGAALRVRHIGERRVQAVKTRQAEDAEGAGGGHLSRGEWEREITGDAPDPDALREAGLGDLLDTKGVADALRPVFATRFRRSAYVLKGDTWEIEMTLDDGEVDTSTACAPLCEVELELRRGRPADLYALARRLAADVPLRVSLTSKAERGYHLAAGTRPEPYKAPPLVLDPGLTAAQAFQAIGRACLHHLLHNEPALREHRAPEAVHQMRVALRRLRSALSLFGDLVAGPQAEALGGEMKWITGELGAARDLDVFLAEILAPVAAAAPHDPGLAALVEIVTGRRDAAYERALAATASARFTHLVLDVAAWLETGDWLTPDDAMARARLEGPVRGLATAILGSRHGRALKKGRHFARLDAEHRHRVRIVVKKLRYATEFFESLYGRRKTKAFRKALAGVQEELGRLNDVAVARALLHDLAEAQDPAAPPPAQRERAFAAGLVAGWHHARVEGPDAATLADATKAWKTFAKAAPFWE